MCWRTYNPQYATPIVAEKDINVFKVVRKYEKRKSMYMPFYFNGNLLYHRGNEYRETVHVEELGREHFKIHHGLHCYDERVCFRALCIGTSKPIFQVIVFNDKLNLTDELDCDYYENDVYVMDCIIPAGTTYYENEHGEIVTERLIIKRFRRPKVKLCQLLPETD